MSAASADFTGKTGDTIQFIFTPQTNGFAYLAGASLTAGGNVTALTVTGNETSFTLPQGDSFVQIAIVDGPVPENGTLSYTVNGGASTDLWTNKPLAFLRGAFEGFGS